MRFTFEEWVQFELDTQDMEHEKHEWFMLHHPETTVKLVNLGWIKPPEPKQTREQIELSITSGALKYDMSIRRRSDLGRKR